MRDSSGLSVDWKNSFSTFCRHNTLADSVCSSASSCGCHRLALRSFFCQYGYAESDSVLSARWHNQDSGAYGRRATLHRKNCSSAYTVLLYHAHFPQRLVMSMTFQQTYLRARCMLRL